MEKENYDIKLEFGDIILAHRSEDEIEQSHEISPHIVITREEDYIVVLQGTSKEQPFEHVHSYYKVEKGRHNLSKDTYFKMNDWKRIHKDKVLKHISKLSKPEKNYIQKKIAYSNITPFHSINWIDIETPPIEVGDIIRDRIYISNEYYYLVVEKTPKYYRCIHLKRDLNDPNNVNINGKYYVFDYEDIVDIEDKENYIRTDALKIDEVKIVLTKYKREKAELSELNADRGTLIGYKGKIYYIYNIEKDSFQAYQVSLNKDESLQDIFINKLKYYTSFQEISIKKKDKNIIPLEKVKEEDIDKLRSIKKDYSRHRIRVQQREKNMIHKKINAGTCITSYIDNKQYIVIYRLGNEVCVLSYEDYFNNEPRVSLVSVSNYRNTSKIQASEFFNILEFIKEPVLRDFHSKTFLNVYESYMNIVEEKEETIKQKKLDFNE